MSNWRAALAMVLSVVVASSCGLGDNREAKGREFLQQRISSESLGLLKLDSFSKTNGYDQDLMGTKMYVLEWRAQISVEADVWKGGNNLVGYWDSFGVVSTKPSRMESLMMASSPRYFAKGTMVSLVGESHLRKTDNGWRVENLSIKSTQVLNPGIEFVGTWSGTYRPDTHTPFDASPTREMVVSQSGSIFNVSQKNLQDKPFTWRATFQNGKLVEVQDDGTPSPPDPMTGLSQQLEFMNDGSIREYNEGEIRYLKVAHPTAKAAQEPAKPVATGALYRFFLSGGTSGSTEAGAGTVVSTPPGINCVYPWDSRPDSAEKGRCWSEFPAGSQVTLTLTIGSDTVFQGWRGDYCTGGNVVCRLTIDKEQSETTPMLVSQKGSGAANQAGGTFIGPWRVPEGLAFLSERQVTGKEIANLSTQELARLRNFVYARHGRAFTSPDLREFFAGQTWYRVDPRYSDSALSSIERENVRIIKALEDTRR